MKAQIQSLECKFEEALSTYNSAFPSLTLKALGGWQAWLLVDMAWCNLRLGNFEQARQGFNRVMSEVDDSHHLDDRAAIFTRLSDGMAVLGERGLEDSFRKAAVEAWELFSILQNDMQTRTLAFLERRGSRLRLESSQSAS
jgi:hypothetical protein